LSDRNRKFEGVVAVFWIVSIIVLLAVLGWAGWFDRRRARSGKSPFSAALVRREQGHADSAGGGGWVPRGGG
jgi:hypothetical protein